MSPTIVRWSKSSLLEGLSELITGETSAGTLGRIPAEMRGEMFEKSFNKVSE